MKQEILSIENGSFRHGRKTVLRNIYVQLFAGEMRAILFNNSEEKKIFLSYLMGTLPIHYGRLYIDDAQIPEEQQKNLLQQTVYVVRNPTSLSREFTILENLFYGKFKPVYLSTKAFEQKATAIFRQFGLNFRPHMPTARLSYFECILVEIIKAYLWDFRVIVLSNITGVLDQREKEIITALLDDLKELGLAFFIIGAFEEILYEQTEIITIIQGGRTIGTYPSESINNQTLRKLLHTYSLPVRNQQPFSSSQPCFALNHITTRLLNDVSLTVHRGEIIKIIYSDDACARELEAIFKGEKRDYQGRIYANNRLYQARTIEEALREGIAFVEENPIETMLFKNLTILDNICYPLSSKLRGFWLQKKYQSSVVQTLNELISPGDFGKKTRDVPIETLYLIIYCKWLLFMPRVLVCLNPFSVADIQVNQIITQMIDYLTSRGIAVIILTSYWPSFCAIHGRTFFLEQGRLEVEAADKKRSV